MILKRVVAVLNQAGVGAMVAVQSCGIVISVAVADEEQATAVRVRLEKEGLNVRTVKTYLTKAVFLVVEK